MRPLLASLLALTLLATATAAASAETYTATGDGVTATLTYHESPNKFGATADRLRIERGGTELFDAKPAPKACKGFPCVAAIDFGGRIKALRVRDLDGDGEPEVVYTAYTGAAHCCVIGQIYSLKGDETGYAAMDRSFGSSAFRLRDVDGDGSVEWVARDERFDSAFTAYAASGKPIQILRIEDGAFVDVTQGFPALIRRDARHYMRVYDEIRDSDDGSALGQIAAWAADRYRLGRRDAALRFLHREARAGRLMGPGRLKGKRFVSKLDGFLLRLDYPKK